MQLHLNINCEYDQLLQCLQVEYTDAMVMAMVMMSCDQKPPLIPQSQDKTHTMIADCGFHQDYCF